MPSEDTASYNPFGNNFLTRGNRFPEFHSIRQLKCTRKLSVSLLFLRRARRIGANLLANTGSRFLRARSSNSSIWDGRTHWRGFKQSLSFAFPNSKKRNNVIFLLLSICTLSLFLSLLFFFHSFLIFLSKFEFALGIFNFNSLFADSYSIRPLHNFPSMWYSRCQSVLRAASKKLGKSDEYERVKWILERDIVTALSAEQHPPRKHPRAECYESWISLNRACIPHRISRETH